MHACVSFSGWRICSVCLHLINHELSNWGGFCLVLSILIMGKFHLSVCHETINTFSLQRASVSTKIDQTFIAEDYSYYSRVPKDWTWLKFVLKMLFWALGAGESWSSTVIVKTSPTPLWEWKEHQPWFLSSESSWVFLLHSEKPPLRAATVAFSRASLVSGTVGHSSPGAGL